MNTAIDQVLINCYDAVNKCYPLKHKTQHCTCWLIKAIDGTVNVCNMERIPWIDGSGRIVSELNNMVLRKIITVDGLCVDRLQF